jgi:ribosomal protein RSM22 (predicted rRNA methylase)
MSTPLALVDRLAARAAVPGLGEAMELVSTRYHQGVLGHVPALRNDVEREAYVAARMPATSAAVAKAIQLGAGAWMDDIHTMLDLGSGPGSAMWAAADVLDLQSITAFERDPSLIALAKDLADDTLPLITWVPGDLVRPPPVSPHDLVIASYAFNELDRAERDAVFAQSWAWTTKALLVVEPGSRDGAGVISALRTWLLANGATIAAPCMHHAACPLAQGGKDWCHQRVRLGRTRLHRHAKGAQRSFEDEPFSFLLALKSGSPSGGGRIIGSVESDKREARMPLCTADGYATHTINRKDDLYKAATKARWGDTWPPSDKTNNA